MMLWLDRCRGSRVARLGGWLGSAVFFLFVATSRGELAGDPETRYRTAVRVLSGHGVALDEPELNTVRFGDRYYNVFFPGQVIQFLPAAALELVVERVTGLGPLVSRKSGEFFACTLITPLMAALGVVGLMRLLQRLGHGDRAAVAGGLLTAFATPWWVFSTSGSEEIALGAISVWALVLLAETRLSLESGAEERVSRRLGAALVLVATGFVFRSTYVAPAAGIGLVSAGWLWPHRGRIAAEWQRLAGWIALAGAILALVPAYNWVRFGDPLETGYAAFYGPLGGLFQTPLAEGLVGNLLSPGKSYFLYMPILLLAIPSFLAGGRARLGSWLGAGVALATAAHLLIYSRFVFWSGEVSWAVRFHTSLIPLLMLPTLAGALWLWQWVAGRAVVVLLAVAAVVVQLAGLSLNEGLEHEQYKEGWKAAGHLDLVPGDAVWTWEGSPLRMRFQNVASKLSGRPFFTEGSEWSQAVHTSWDIFPFRADAVGLSRTLVLGLYALWAAALAAGFALLVPLARSLRSARPSSAARASPSS